MNIIIMGPQGSGKGTQAKKLMEKYEIVHICTGDIFRSMAASENPLGIEAREKYWGPAAGGKLVPDDITNELVKKRLAMPDVGNGFILDGYPRTIGQAEYLESITNSTVTNIGCVIFLELDEPESIRRLSARRSCPKCGTPYNTLTRPPINSDFCDKDGAALIQREDDTPETIMKRRGEYNEKTALLIEFYRKKGILYSVDASKGVDDVFADIVKILKK